MSTRKLTAKQLARLRSYRTHETAFGRPCGNLARDPQSEALFERGMVYVDGRVLEPGIAALRAADIDEPRTAGAFLDVLRALQPLTTAERVHVLALVQVHFGSRS